MIITNADRIRTMNNEELGKMFRQIVKQESFLDCCDNNVTCEAFMSWLKAEAKEVKTEEKKNEFNVEELASLQDILNKTRSIYAEKEKKWRDRAKEICSVLAELDWAKNEYGVFEPFSYYRGAFVSLSILFTLNAVDIKVTDREDDDTIGRCRIAIEDFISDNFREILTKQSELFFKQREEEQLLYEKNQYKELKKKFEPENEKQK